MLQGITFTNNKLDFCWFPKINKLFGESIKYTKLFKKPSFIRSDSGGSQKVSSINKFFISISIWSRFSNLAFSFKDSPFKNKK